jgi:cephalosporin hydroxylase
MNKQELRLSEQDVQALCDRYYIENYVPELMGMLEYVYAVGPQVLMEIGVAFGGTLKIWEKVVPPGGLIIGVDHTPDILRRLTGEEVWSEKPMDWELEWSEGNILKLQSDREIYVIIGEGADPQVANVVGWLLRGRKIDFWFHDGMHYGPAALYDYYNFKHLISSSGLVCVADINNMRNPDQWVDNCGCQVLARELPEPKDHPLEGHCSGMCMWRKQEWSEFDPAALAEKHNLRIPGPNTMQLGIINPTEYTYPNRG